MSDIFISAKELAEITGKTDRTIRKIADKEGWEFKLQTDRGGAKKVYAMSCLPDEFKIACNVNDVTATPRSMSASGYKPSIAQVDKGLAKADLLRLYLLALKKAEHGNKRKARNTFMRLYNSGATWPELYKTLGNLSWKTIENWKTQVKECGDVICLSDRRGGWNRGQRSINEIQAKILLQCALHPNRPKIAEVVRMAHAIMDSKGIPNGHSEKTYRRWLNEWKENNYHIWTFSRQGAKAWNDQCAFYIERDYSLINVGDILVADGHVLNFEIINPWTGKPKRMILIVWKDMKSNFPLGWEIMPTENTQAIASAFRRAILRLGKYPQVAYLDNGKAFSARFFNGVDFEQAGISGLFERIGCKTIFAWPYHGQSKTVERFFGTFAELERWCPTYTGTDIAHKPPRMMRGERIHRSVYDRLTQGGCLTLEQAHMAIAAWFDEYVNRPQRGHLNGRTPAEVFIDGKGEGVDKAELTYLMMSMEIRTIHRNGISFLGQNYYHPALYGRRHAVVIRYDLQDPSALWVFDRENEFLCMAEPVEKVHPAANALGTDADKEKLKSYIADKKRQEREASISARAFLMDEVIPENRRRLEAIGIGGPDRPEVKKQISAPVNEERILKEARELESLQDAPEENKVEYIPQVADETAAVFKKLPTMSEMDRFYKLIELEVKGVMIPKEWQAFMKYYEMSAEYSRYADMFEDHRSQAAIMYQVQEDDNAGCY